MSQQSLPLDQSRLAHLGCPVKTLINDPHITSAAEAEQEFWQHHQWKQQLQQLVNGCVLVVDMPSVLMSACEAIDSCQATCLDWDADWLQPCSSCKAAINAFRYPIHHD